MQEALNERRVFLHISPYLSHELPTMLPVYSRLLAPYYWAGAKVRWMATLPRFSS